MWSPSAPHAYGDESFQETEDGTGYYVLAAAIVRPSLGEPVRTAMREVLRPASALKLHWRDLDGPDRRTVVDLVASLPVEHLVAVGTPQAGVGASEVPDRATPPPRGLGVACLSLERRTGSLDRKDIATVTACRAGHRGGPLPHVDHVLPSTEPLTWIADVVAGASALSRRGDGSYLKTLDGVVVEFDVPLGP